MFDDVLVAGRGVQQAPPLVLARFRHLEPGASVTATWADDLDISIVMLSGSLGLATGSSKAVVQRDDVVVLGSQRCYEVTNHRASADSAWFVEFWMRRDRAGPPTRPRLHRIMADRHRRIRTIVELVATPRVSAVILYGGDTVTHEVRPRQAAYVVTTVGAIAINDRWVGAVSAAVVRGTGLVHIRALESTEVLLVPLPDIARPSAPAVRRADQPAMTDAS